MRSSFSNGMVDVGTLGSLASDIYKKNFKYFIMVGLGIYIPVGLVLEIMFRRINPFMALQAGDMSSLFWLLMVTGMITLVVLPLETAALTYFAGQSFNDAEVNQEGVMEATFGRWRRLFLTEAIYFAIVFFSVILIIPAIIFGVLACFCLNIVVVENLSGFAAIRKSIEIVRHRWWRTLVLLIMIGLSETVVKIILGMVTAIFVWAIGLILGPESIALQAAELIMSAIVETACMLLRLFGVLYFFNLYYTYDTGEEAIL